MKILFLVPPALDGNLPAERIFGCNYGIYAQPNIFILHPATILKNKGYDITLVDFPINGKKKSDFEEFCKKSFFDIVVFYSVFLSKKTDIIARNILGSANPKTKYIFMGTEPTASPDDFIDERSTIIRGEPESRILEVVRALENNSSLDKILGISYGRDSKNIHQSSCPIIENLDDLPFPDRTLLDSENYNNPKLSFQPFTTILASRGCSFNCYYCVPNSQSFSREIEYKRNSNSMRKPPVRLRSPKNVVEEFSLLATAGYKSISFIDDQFVWGDERTIEICNGIAQFGIEWSCLARADMLQNPKITKAMAKSGCKYVDIGVESFNQEILDYIGKDCKVDMIYSAVKNLKDANIGVELNILLAASPLETKETIEKTFRETINLDADYVLFSVCTPFPYTKFNERAKKEGWMIKSEYEAIDPMKESFISYPHLTKKELDRIIKQLYLRYYFRPSYIFKKLRHIKGRKDLLNKIKAALAILK